VDTKERILDATAGLFQRYGYSGTGLKQIGAHAGAPFGSIYHFFPGGKEQLGEEVIRHSGHLYQQLVLGVLRAAPDPVSAVRAAFSGAAELLAATDYADACPIATVASEVASSNEALRLATADVFDGWVAALTQFLVEGQVSPKRAGDLAIVLIELLEGGFLLSRAAKRTEPMAVAADAAAALVATALPQPRS
jgi:AcrR family transcriptional regulator